MRNSKQEMRSKFASSQTEKNGLENVESSNQTMSKWNLHPTTWLWIDPYAKEYIVQ